MIQSPSPKQKRLMCSTKSQKILIPQVCLFAKYILETSAVLNLFNICKFGPYSCIQANNDNRVDSCYYFVTYRQVMLELLEMLISHKQKNVLHITNEQIKNLNFLSHNLGKTN